MSKRTGKRLHTEFRGMTPSRSTASRVIRKSHRIVVVRWFLTRRPSASAISRSAQATSAPSVGGSTSRFRSRSVVPNGLGSSTGSPTGAAPALRSSSSGCGKPKRQSPSQQMRRGPRCGVTEQATCGDNSTPSPIERKRAATVAAGDRGVGAEMERRLAAEWVSPSWGRPATGSG